jgi:tRNA threonylcarbamoyladenosine biosynthesis protein TsaE
MKKKYSIENIQSIKIDIIKPSIIFIKGDLWAWKTTLTKHIISNILGKSYNIISPTYTYYNKYEDIFHFDLFRLKTYDEFFAIWGEDILDNNEWIIIIEWPELLEKYYSPDIEIVLNKTEKEDERIIMINYNK